MTIYLFLVKPITRYKSDEFKVVNTLTNIINVTELQKSSSDNDYNALHVTLFELANL
jgi:hypothetical protein